MSDGGSFEVYDWVANRTLWPLLGIAVGLTLLAGALVTAPIWAPIVIYNRWARAHPVQPDERLDRVLSVLVVVVLAVAITGLAYVMFASDIGHWLLCDVPGGKPCP